jgi:hypothetical protein
MYKLSQVNTLMKVSTNSHAVGIPIDSLHNGGRPLVPLLDVVEKRRTVSCVANIGLVIVGNSSIVDLELGAGVGK